ncbi:alpha/beta fold hydrolase [Sphingosinicella sp. CPCC 101087]|uniref:alpha/beta fold hydrolase n=1 Tax=Sphingosinicella sp. CPCC 101087 TaxID=2497754 RepID=UPI00101D5C2A|nr:alpha/beta hydrolase [Sphingosinicella sp. CPCC 101087]
MLRSTIVAMLAATAAAIATPSAAHAGETNTTRTASQAPARSGHVEANGVNYYYEIHGEGEPLLLLHGGLGSIDMFAPILPILSRHRQVIAVDLHGHGRTSLGERRIDVSDIGDDLDIVVKALGYDEVDVLGYSFGGWSAFRLAVQHPDTVRRLVLVASNLARDGFFPEMLPQQAQVNAAMAPAMRDTPMYKSYAAVAPDPGEFPRLLDNMGDLMRAPYDWREDVGRLGMPVMLVYGDSDMIRPEHIVDIYQRLGGGLRDAGWQREHMSRNRLAILPGLTHYEVGLAPEMARTVLPFLDGTSEAPNWAAQVDAQTGGH